ncbi:MAG: PQQ-binding-like beta-propeller repeat protein [Opitutales bacterium]
MSLLYPLFLSSLLLFSTAIADWPRFLGPTGNPVAAEAEVPLRWSASENLLWQTALPGPGAASPVVYEDRIYVVGYQGYAGRVFRDRYAFQRSGFDPGDPAELAYFIMCLRLSDG